jgi:hypothetical protein
MEMQDRLAVTLSMYLTNWIFHICYGDFCLLQIRVFIYVTWSSNVYKILMDIQVNERCLTFELADLVTKVYIDKCHCQPVLHLHTSIVNLYQCRSLIVCSVSMFAIFVTVNISGKCIRVKKCIINNNIRLTYICTIENVKKWKFSMKIISKY